MNFQQKDTRANAITAQINTFHQNVTSLPAAASSIEIDVLSRQLVDSINRVDYFQKVQSRPISLVRTDPTHILFDPIRAILYYKNHDLDEAFWLAFFDDPFWRKLSFKMEVDKNFLWKFRSISKINLGKRFK